MALNDETNIPTDEELTVPEVKLTGVVLRAAAFHLGKYCEGHNNEFMLCRDETEDPSACVNEGKAVTSCTLEFFRLLKNKCADEFKSYYNCIDRSSSNYKFTPCRKRQDVFDKCMLDNLNIPRAEYGYFCLAKIHQTDRPKPEEEIQVFDDYYIPDRLYDDCFPDRRDAKYGLRNISRWF